ncbi:MAG: alpha/beta hydrolase fold domain-containing protein [Gammaproteobacteria bacterium]|nr:alpha/beta hydrolase fold domain-containing protein [Gammaproteobacteria bacterium]
MNLYRHFTSQEEIDAEYNAGAAVADPKAYLDRYIADSEQTRQSLSCELDAAYGPTLDEYVDIFPSARANSPVFVFIHGGYWRARTAKEFSFVARELVPQDITVVVVNYSLCPKVTISEISRQTRAVIAWLSEHAQQYNGDADNIVVSGHSAGGHLTGMVCSTDWQNDYGLDNKIVKGGLALSGLFDLRPLRFSYLQPVLMINDETIRMVNPIDSIPEEGPPMLLAVGEKESLEFHRQSADYAKLRLEKGLACEVEATADDDHFSILFNFLDSNSSLFGKTLALMGKA